MAEDTIIAWTDHAFNPWMCLMTLPCELDYAQGQQLQTLARQANKNL